jgi:hypothetical protein
MVIVFLHLEEYQYLHVRHAGVCDKKVIAVDYPLATLRLLLSDG